LIVVLTLCVEFRATFWCSVICLASWWHWWGVADCVSLGRTWQRCVHIR